jgi:hypothetical protein
LRASWLMAVISMSSSRDLFGFGDGDLLNNRDLSFSTSWPFIFFYIANASVYFPF